MTTTANSDASNTSISTPTAPSSTTQASTAKSPNTNGNPLRKLVEKLVYLDLNSYKHTSKVKECFQLLDIVSAVAIKIKYSDEIDLNPSERWVNNDTSIKYS